MWTTIRKWILTEKNLQKIGFYMPNVCLLCKQHAETVNHLLVHYAYKNKMWNMLLQEAGMMWVFLMDVKELVNHRKFMRSSRKRCLWRLMVPAIWWSIWL